MLAMSSLNDVQVWHSKRLVTHAPAKRSRQPNLLHLSTCSFNKTTTHKGQEVDGTNGLRHVSQGTVPLYTSDQGGCFAVTHTAVSLSSCRTPEGCIIHPEERYSRNFLEEAPEVSTNGAARCLSGM